MGWSLKLEVMISGTVMVGNEFLSEMELTIDQIVPVWILLFMRTLALWDGVRLVHIVSITELVIVFSISEANPAVY